MEEKGAADVTPVPAVHVTVEQLEAMFPSLDAALVRVLAADASTPQQAMETLLALMAATTEAAAPALPPRDLGLDDIDAFPSLADADGWQISSRQLFDRDPEADLGSAWCDRAREIASKPEPCPVVKAAAAPLVGTQKKLASKDEGAEVVPPETEYELRQRLGKQRISNRARFHRKRADPLLANAGSQLGVADGEDEDDYPYAAEVEDAEGV